MSDHRHTEAAFETVIEAHLLANGYTRLASEGFDRERAIFPETVLAFIRETQPPEWAKLEALHGAQDRRAGPHGPLQVDGRERLARHAATWLQVLRAHASRGLLQGRPRAEPGARSPLRRQPPRAHPPAAFLAPLGEVARCHAEPERHPNRHGGAEEPAHRPDGRGRACASTSSDRDPREPIFEFKRRTLVHFAVDTEAVLYDDAAGGERPRTSCPSTRALRRRRRRTRPIRPGATYRTAYLWEEVLRARQPARPPRPLHPPADRGEARRPGPQGEDRDDDLPALPPASGGAPAGRRGADARAWGTTTSSSTRPAAARATRSAGWRIGSRRCTTLRTSACSTA